MVHVVRQTRHELVVAVGFFLHDIHDVVNHDAAEQAAHVVDHGYHKKVVFVHDSSYFDLVGGRGYGADRSVVNPRDGSFGSGGQELFKRERSEQNIMVVNDIDRVYHLDLFGLATHFANAAAHRPILIHLDHLGGH